jgi:hypothetical protein
VYPARRESALELPPTVVLPALYLEELTQGCPTAASEERRHRVPLRLEPEA